MSFENILKSEKRHLLAEERVLRDKLAKLPVGELVIWKNGKGSKWAKVENGNRHYLPKKNVQEAETLAEKVLIREQLNAVHHKLDVLEICINGFNNTPKCESQKKNAEYKQFLTNLKEKQHHDDHEWAEAPYKRYTDKAQFLIHDTLKGDKVRSKSEALIADSLYRANIPYRYEQEIEFNSIYMHPDFLIRWRGEEIIWEHLGLITKDNYMRVNLTKIGDYISYGYYPGENLVFTSETPEKPLNSIIVERLIDCFVLR